MKEYEIIDTNAGCHWLCQCFTEKWNRTCHARPLGGYDDVHWRSQWHPAHS